VFLNVLWELNNVKWEKAIILYLKDNTESEKSLFYKYIYKNNVMNQF